MTPPHGTEKSYLLDSYTHHFDASVLECVPDDEERFVVRLDRSYFYPESGGQLADRGRIGDATVSHVWEDEAGVVYHHTSAAVDPGAVECLVDWELRFDHMQQHTGQHLLSRAFINVADLDTISFHMGDEYCSIDLNAAAVDEVTIRRAEEEANRIVWEDRPVIVKTVATHRVEEPLLRKAIPDGVAEARLVEVEGYDVIGCCGTHVRRTGELGLIKTLKSEKSKGATRVFFLVGRRSCEDYRSKHEVLRRIANRLTTSVDGIDEKIEKLVAEGRDARRDVQRLTIRLADHEAERLHATAQTLGGMRVVCSLIEDGTDDEVRRVSALLKQRPGLVAVVASSAGLVVANAAEDVAVDFGPLVELAREQGGKGGGKRAFANLQLPAGASVERFLDDARDWMRRLPDGGGGGE